MFLDRKAMRLSSLFAAFLFFSFLNTFLNTFPTFLFLLIILKMASKFNSCLDLYLDSINYKCIKKAHQTNMKLFEIQDSIAYMRQCTIIGSSRIN